MISALTVCALFAARGLVRFYNIRQEEAAEEDTSEQILDLDTAQAASLTFTVGGTEETFVRADETWTLQADDTFPVDETALETTLSALATLSATRTLEDAEELSEYGLSEPVNTVTYTDEDGNETSVLLGDINTSSDFQYAALASDTTTVYTIPTALGESLSDDLYDYAVSEDLPALDADEVQTVEVTADDADDGAAEDETAAEDEAATEAEDNAEAAAD